MNINATQLGAGLLIGAIIGVGLTLLGGTFLTSTEERTVTITSTTAVTTSTVTTTTSLTTSTTTTIITDTITTTSISSTTVTITTTVTTTRTIGQPQEFLLQSSSFNEGDNIPTKYTCDGANVSPPLLWNNPPEGTVSFVMIMDDPDAPIGVFTHWVLFNLPADTLELPEALPSQGVLENGGIHGRNGVGQLGYFGPCPPPGPSHTYRFQLYAIDIMLTLDSGASKGSVLSAINGHILAEVVLTGEYRR